MVESALRYTAPNFAAAYQDRLLGPVPWCLIPKLTLERSINGALIAVVAESGANAALRSSWRLSDRISKHGDETEALVHWLAT